MRALLMTVMFLSFATFAFNAEARRYCDPDEDECAPRYVKPRPKPQYRIPPAVVNQAESAVKPQAKVNPAPVATNDRVLEAYKFFIKKGWSREQSAGIVGNLQAEVGPLLRFEGLAGDGGRSIGLAQWNGIRLTRFHQLYKIPLHSASFELQLEYVNWELHNTEAAAGNILRKAKDAATAAALVDQHYERSAGWHRRGRIINANNILAMHGKKEMHDLFPEYAYAFNY